MTLFEFLVEHSPFEPAELRAIVGTAPRRYKTYEIAKRSGRGTRTIAQPAPEVKLLQRLLVEHFIDKWPLHDAATAYRIGDSIAEHAERHIHSNFLLKLDFQDFFPSITAKDIRAHVALVQPTFSAYDVEVLSNLLSWRNKKSKNYCLSIGAPSSPSCSNALLYEFDSRVSAFCTIRNVTYSRYADDMAFSCRIPDALKEVAEFVRTTIDGLSYPKLRLNDAKTVNVSKKYRRSLVGLVLTPDEQVSIGRTRKRQIRATLHHFTHGRLDADDIGTLRGMLAFAWSIEPAFIHSLVRTYGEDSVAELGLPFKVK
jgi:RNA-directed DNA polymerase